MSLTLSDFKKYTNIVIQCHDNPDADALASGFALKKYFESIGKSARFVYGGRLKVNKPNLCLMLERLEIPAEYVTELDKPELLITVDCQYGESNVTHFDADEIAVIDHHRISGELPALSDVRSAYGACSTVMYELLSAEGYDINADRKLATALYYGLMTDTGDFGEISHPSDKDLRDFAKFNSGDIVLFKNSNLTREELSIAGDALNSAVYNEKHKYGIISSKPCDPNILGVISDMFLEVSCNDTCLVYTILPFGVKLSVRSCIREVQAGELAAFLAEGVGGGGGHLFKAGGFLKKELLEQAGIAYEPKALNDFLSKRMEDYFDNTVIIYASKHKEDISKCEPYVKNSLTLGYVKASRLAKPGRVITIRTLEGDVDVKVEEDTYIMIGIEGEIYPCGRARFERSYRLSDKPYVYPGEYAPAVIDVVNGEKIDILPMAESCETVTDGSVIYARKLDNRVKVFTAWDKDKYYLGKPGDYLAARADDTSDVYIIADSIFKKTYSPKK